MENKENADDNLEQKKTEADGTVAIEKDDLKAK